MPPYPPSCAKHSEKRLKPENVFNFRHTKHCSPKTLKILARSEIENVDYFFLDTQTFLMYASEKSRSKRRHTVEKRRTPKTTALIQKDPAPCDICAEPTNKFYHNKIGILVCAKCLNLK